MPLEMAGNLGSPGKKQEGVSDEQISDKDLVKKIDRLKLSKDRIAKIA